VFGESLPELAAALQGGLGTWRQRQLPSRQDFKVNRSAWLAAILQEKTIANQIGAISTRPMS